MFSIYIDKNALSRICKENAGKDNVEDQSPWYRIIANQDKVYTNISNRLADTNQYDDEINEIDNSDKPDISRLKELITFRRLAALGKDEQTTVLPCDKVNIESIDPSTPASCKVVIDDPCAVYLLDITPDAAAKIQKKYGVICQSTQIELEDNPLLTGEGISSHPKVGNSSYGWLRVLKRFKDMPSSAIVINDRNLFTNDEVIRKQGGRVTEKTLGIQNVKEILEQVVPKHFNGGEYHILICSDIIDIGGTHVTFEFVKNKLEEIRLELKKTRGNRFDIDLELFVFYSNSKYKKPNGEGHEDTHNRRILSNYFIFTFEHKINAFDGNKSLCTQSINGHKLFHTGIYEDGNDTGEKLHRDMISEFSKFLKAYTSPLDPSTANNLDSVVKYAINGEEKNPSQLLKMTNRILFP